jgi:type IV pilus assembly protein PilY1
MHNKLGGIMHSAPVVIRAGNSRVDHPSLARRRETAYVGDLYGMLHAIDTETVLELWSYIPSNLLGKLQNERTDPNAEPDFAAVDGSPSARDIYWDHDADPTTADQWRTILVCSQGFGGNSIFVLDVTHPSDWDVLWEATNDSAPGGGMGYSFRTALDRVKVPVLDQDGNPIPGKYAVKWMVYVATSFSDIAEDHGGINVFAFDLETGIEQWVFSSTYADSVNDIPGAVTTFDIDDDTLADRIFVGDMNGRMWEIALTDDPAGNYEAGESVHEYDGPDPSDPDKTLNIPIPLYAAGIGNPISVSPAVITKNSHVILIFGTGGADWAGNDKRYHVLAVDATEVGRLTQNEKNTFYKLYGMPMEPPSDPVLTNKFVPLKLTLEPGEKVWSSPTFSAGQIWVVTSFGSMESVDPTGDKAGYSNLRLLSLDKDPEDWPDPKKIGKVRGSIFVSRKHVYMTTFDGEMLQFGDEDFTAGTGNRVVLKAWHDK